MTRSLRYARLEDLPPAMRARVELLQTRARIAGADVEKDWREAGALKRKRATHRRDVEHEQQVVFFNRIRALAANNKAFASAAARTYAIPNGGGRTPREAGRLKAEGVLKGVSDIFVSWPALRACMDARDPVWHGLYIEMKSATGRVSAEQQAWLDASATLGYAAAVCWNADDAVSVWRAYVLGDYKHA